MSHMRLEVVTPERTVYSEDVNMISARIFDGDIGILPKHSRLVSPLDVTKVRIKKDGVEDFIMVNRGFLEVTPDKVTILTESAELSGEIDVERATRAKERAEHRLKDGGADSYRAEEALKRALNRLGD